MVDILVLGRILIPPCETNGKFNLHNAGDFKHSADAYDYLAKNCVDIVILDILSKTSPKQIRRLGFKGLIIGSSNDSAPSKMLRKFMERNFNMYFCCSELQNNLIKIVDSYSSVPEFRFDPQSGGLDLEVYEHIIKDSGKFLHKQFADSFFEAHPQANWAFITQDKRVIHYEKNIEPDVYDLYALMLKNQKYIFLFNRKEKMLQTA